jgi:hypothetical protein
MSSPFLHNDNLRLSDDSITPETSVPRLKKSVELFLARAFPPLRWQSEISVPQLLSFTSLSQARILIRSVRYPMQKRASLVLPITTVYYSLKSYLKVHDYREVTSSAGHFAQVVEDEVASPQPLPLYRCRIRVIEFVQKPAILDIARHA